jgi:hypothetical protein
MVNTLDRSAVKKEADDFWFKPCRDGLVYVPTPLNVDAQRAPFGCPDPDWWPVFLVPRDNPFIDGLYFVKSTVTPADLNTHGYSEVFVKEEDRVLVQAWAGLNDCAHFVSECLKAGGVKQVYNVGVGKLVKGLRARGDTKTLANLVDLAASERVVATGILKIGDIIAYGGENMDYVPHGHSTVFMGNEAVANHTRLNHPDFKGREGGKGNWKVYADPRRGHPKVTIIHFGHDDPSLSGSDLLGWWNISFNDGRTYAYHFTVQGDTNGMVAWATGANRPIAGRGYWFDRGSNEFIDCWTSTGSVERFKLNTDGTIGGKLNDGVEFTGTKMS